MGEERHVRGGVAIASRTGFTLIETLIAIVLGVVVLGAAMGFLLVHMRTLEGSQVRDGVARNSRYLGIALRHDLQTAGIEINSTPTFGTLAAYPGSAGDTLVILHVPYDPRPFPPHDLAPPAGNDNPLPAGGTCGARCIDVVKKAGEAMEIGIGDLARLQIGSTRRLLLITDMQTTSDTSAQLTFSAHDTILHQPAGLTGGLRLDRFATFVQELRPIIYYRGDQDHLWRATRLNADGSPAGELLAFGVRDFEVELGFTDGDLLPSANAFDSDDTNDCDDVVSAVISASVVADRVDPRVNGGQLLTRQLAWEIAPRNLRYEKNRR